MKELITHVSVLLRETIEGLDIKHDDVVLDATLGGGGHSSEALQKLDAQGILIALDADKAALDRSEDLLKSIASKKNIQLILKQSNFRNIDVAVAGFGISAINKAIFDLGLSSQEIEESGRGFTFRKNEPLLMTFSSNVDSNTLTAKNILNNWDEGNIETIIKAYGEERYSKRIAKAIVDARLQKPIETTFDLVDIVMSATPTIYHHGKIHPATRTFQALRMTVNDEVRALQDALEKTFLLLSNGGRIAVISFHSIEDRIVKHFFKEKIMQKIALGITKKPIVPSEEEILKNPRSRSAKLRIVEKI